MPKQTDITKLLRDQSLDYHALPRHPPVPHFENDEVHNYDVNRRHAYPNNPNANLGDEPAQRDYNEYKQHNITANKSAAEYWRDYINTAGSETKDLPSLNKNQHRALLGSASQAAADTNMHYQSRVKHLYDYPYAHSNIEERRAHEGCAEIAGIRADLYQNRFERHYKRSGPDAVSGPRSYSSITGSGFVYPSGSTTQDVYSSESSSSCHSSSSSPPSPRR
ncbi:hypothetical protein NPX13_g58 [Xylaria arbuscula]|uniref:Uncharacterized protein n=1 Tax=Xylaria arbuscula TaxID=114810 RepID=A0A9W8NNJ7_9PEZI|nr:hypothetical protein NPX13_g58 [Xylaria arbuscula]